MATSTLGSGTLVLAGTTSGTTTVTATAVAGTTTLTLPAATDTLVGKATTDTLTNKTLTGAVMNGTVGATTPSTGAFTSLSATGVLNLSGSGQLHQLSGHNFMQGDATRTYLYGGTSGIQIRSSNNATELSSITDAGIVTMNAYGAGAATFSAAGVISSVSDETWKIKDGVPVDPDSMLKKLEPGYWFYNDEKKETFGSDRQLGFYAQNVNAAIGPEAAPTPEEGKPWGYYDRSVLAVTVMSLQKALATIETLTARISALESA